jgi:hypothetical protein
MAVFSVAKSAPLLRSDGCYYESIGPLVLDDEQNPSGQGIWYRSDGTESYRGGMRAGTRHGWGVLSLPDGDRYEGEWQNDKLHGQGRYQWQNGHTYNGSWVDGERSGLGCYSFQDGSSHEGEFSQDLLSGFAVARSHDGHITECGLWSYGCLEKSCCIPISKLPVKSFLSDAGTLHVPDVC